jgi:hypothetical protein
MKNLLSASLLFLLVSTSDALAQSKAVKEAVGKVQQGFCDAWASRFRHHICSFIWAKTATGVFTSEDDPSSRLGYRITCRRGR